MRFAGEMDQIQALCEQWGYGNVSETARLLWHAKDPVGGNYDDRKRIDALIWCEDHGIVEALEMMARGAGTEERKTATRALAVLRGKVKAKRPRSPTYKPHGPICMVCDGCGWTEGTAKDHSGPSTCAECGGKGVQP